MKVDTIRAALIDQGPLALRPIVDSSRRNDCLLLAPQQRFIPAHEGSNAQEDTLVAAEEATIAQYPLLIRYRRAYDQIHDAAACEKAPNPNVFIFLGVCSRTLSSRGRGGTFLACTPP